MLPSSRLNFMPKATSGGSHLPGPNWTTPSMLTRARSFEPPPSREQFRSAFLALPMDTKYYQALDRLTQLTPAKGGAVSKQMFTLTCSFSSPDDQEDFWKWLEDGQGVKVPWKAGATLT